MDTGGSGFADKLMEKINPYAQLIKAGMGTAQGILQQFRPDQAGLQKIAATKSQQAVETSAKQIEQRVMSGEITPAAGLAAIKQLEMSLGAGGNEYDARGGGMANNILAQVKANIMSRQTQNMNAPLNTERLGGSSAEQKGQLASLMRNRLLGTSMGNDLKSTPLEGAFKQRNPLAQFGDVTGQVRQQFPQLGAGTNDLAARIKQRLGAI